LAGKTDPDEADVAWHGLASIDLNEGAYAAAREKLERALTMRQEIGDRYGEAAAWYQLGRVAVRQDKVVEGLRMLGLCYLIDHEIGHGDADSDFQAVAQVAAQLDYTPDQLAETLRDVWASYAYDRGATLLRQALG
jgi:tetratricopeptide (TPR) repeat protein